MVRPHVYKPLDRLMMPGETREHVVLGHDHMYGIKKGSDWVTLCKEDIYGFDLNNVNRKYTRLFFVSEKAAQNQVDKLNKMFNSTEYKIAKV